MRIPPHSFSPNPDAMSFLRIASLVCFLAFCLILGCSSRRSNPAASAAPAALPRGESTATPSDSLPPERWQTGQIVHPGDVSRYGAARCFRSMELPDSVFLLMQGRSYPEGCPIGRAELRYLHVLHYDLEGRIRVGEMVCHRSMAQALTEIFHELFEARYPIGQMVLIDRYEADDERSMRANNTSCFNYRSLTGGKSISKHGRGLAVDINPLYNPYVRRRRDGSRDVRPHNARPYADRKAQFACKITAGDRCHRLFLQHGFRWGGAWRSLKDYQHFER